MLLFMSSLYFFSAPSISFEPLSLDDPLYIMFSSGTTGKPKCIVHSNGGILLKHLVEIGLHSNIRKNSKVFYFTTCGWMMWNWMVSALTLGNDPITCTVASYLSYL